MTRWDTHEHKNNKVFSYQSLIKETIGIWCVRFGIFQGRIFDALLKLLEGLEPLRFWHVYTPVCTQRSENKNEC